MVRVEQPGQIVEHTGPKHGFAKPAQPGDVDAILESGPEISALEHAIRMAPAGWSFEDEGEGGTR